MENVFKWPLWPMAAYIAYPCFPEDVLQGPTTIPAGPRDQFPVKLRKPRTLLERLHPHCPELLFGVRAISVKPSAEDVDLQSNHRYKNGRNYTRPDQGAISTGDGPR